MYSIDDSRRRDGSALCPARRVFNGILALLLVVFPNVIRAQDPDKTGGPVDRIPVRLWPTTQPQDDKSRPKSMTLDGWTYRAVPAASPRDGVPWEVIVEPSKENNAGWRKAGEHAVLPMLQAEMCRENDTAKKTKSRDAVPTIEMPDVLWKQRMAADLQDVVGIHFHEYVSDDLAGILFTIHKVELDEAGKESASSKKHKLKTGTRLEATLLAPLIWSLDQSIVVRVDPLHKELTASRAEHEMGHAQVSSRVLLEAPEGPQNWNLQRCTGRRSRLEYYWKRELIGREWDGYRGGKLLTLRTSIAIVPPTRWSMLLPIPPDRVTQKHIQDFNDAIVRVGPQFILADQQAQDKFHSHHGSFERAPGP